MSFSAEKIIPGQNQDPSTDTIDKDMKAWLEAQERIKEAREMLNKLLLALHTMKNSLLGVREVMMAMMSMQGDTVAGFSAMDNVASDMRSDITNAQGQVTNIAGSTESPEKKDAAAQKLVDLIKHLEGFLKSQSTSGNPIIDSDSIKNMQTAINNIKAPFGSDWGNARRMEGHINTWVIHARDTGVASPELKQVQDNFQTLNQSTSAFSTTTNTSLQFNDEQYKQDLTMASGANKTYIDLVSAFVRNQKAN